MNVAIPQPLQLQKYAVAGIPVLGLIGALLVIFPHYQGLRADEKELEQIKGTVLDKQMTLAQLKNLPSGPTVARVPATRDEPVEFLRNLNQLAGRCRVRLVSYTAIAAPSAPTGTPQPPPIPGTGKPAAAAADGGLPPGTTPSALTIKAEGTYAATALFFGRLETYPRLLSVSRVTMNADAARYPIVATEFELTRYLGEADAVPTPSASGSPTLPAPK